MERRELLSTIFVSVSILLGLLSAKLLLLILPFYALFLRKTSGPIVFSFREWILLGVVSTYVAVGLIFSVFRFNSLSFAIDLLTVTIVSLIVRRDKYLSSRVIDVMGVIFNVLASILLVLNIVFYIVHHYECVSVLGFESLTDFKLLYLPLFMLCNDNATMLLCFLPFLTLMSIAMRKRKIKLWSLVNMSMCVLSIIFSYSRGAYFSMFFFFLITFVLIFLFRREQLKRMMFILLMSMLPAICVVFLSQPIRTSVETTVSLFKTESQRRSFNSRVERLKNVSSDAVLFGKGDGNYFISNLKSKTEYDTLVSASSNNMALQLWEERGIVGYAFVVSIAILLGGMVLKNIRRGNICALLMVAGILALILRELSFASMTRISSVFFLSVVMLFLSSVYHKREYEKV